MTDHRYHPELSGTRRRRARRGLSLVTVCAALVAVVLLPKVEAPKERLSPPVAATTVTPAPHGSSEDILTLRSSPDGPPDDSSEEDDYEDETGIADVYADCVTPDRLAEVQVNSGGWDTSEGDLIWTLELDGIEIFREPFAYSDGDYEGPHHLQDLRPGRYGLLVLTVDSGHLVDWIDFEVIECVTAEEGCRSVTFTNPPGNPALDVTYGQGEDDESDDEPYDDKRSFTLARGETRTVSTERRVVGWEAWGAGGAVLRSFGGEDYQLGVSQHCGPTMTRANIRCDSGSRALVDFWFNPPRDQRAQFKIIDFHEVVATGTVADDHHLRVRLRAGDLYSLRAYTAEAVLPYDLVYFGVDPCLRVRPTCRGLMLTNPHEYADYRVRYSVDNGRDRSLNVRAGKTKRIRVAPESKVTWRLDHDSSVEGWPEWSGSSDDGGTVTLPSRC
jgi:hypothetical protein